MDQLPESTKIVIEEFCRELGSILDRITGKNIPPKTTGLARPADVDSSEPVDQNSKNKRERKK